MEGAIRQIGCIRKGQLTRHGTEVLALEHNHNIGGLRGLWLLVRLGPLNSLLGHREGHVRHHAIVGAFFVPDRRGIVLGSAKTKHGRLIIQNNNTSPINCRRLLLNVQPLAQVFSATELILMAIWSIGMTDGWHRPVMQRRLADMRACRSGKNVSHM